MSRRREPKVVTPERAANLILRAAISDLARCRRTLAKVERSIVILSADRGRLLTEVETATANLAIAKEQYEQCFAHDTARTTDAP